VCGERAALSIRQLGLFQFRHAAVPAITPAMAAGVTDRLWEMADLVKMLESWEAAEQRKAT
jgi:hypothetical protein